MAKIALTDLSVRKLQPPKKGQRAFWDESLPGFGIRLSQGGARTWILLDPRSKVRTQETIGRYPIVSLQEARGEAKRRLAENTLGKHKPRAVKWSVALEAYLKEVARNRKPRTHSDYKRLLNRHFRFGETLVSNISPHDIQRRLDKLVDTPSEHHHAFVGIRAFMNWAHSKHYVSDNPVRRMKAPDGSKSRERILSDSELKQIWNACPNDTFGRIVKLLILTGQRRGEIAGLTPEMIEGDAITLPATLTKNGRAHKFPIGPIARELLVWPMQYGGFGKAKARLDAASGVKDWTLHDLRRTFASGLASLGVALPTIEKLLNHVSGSFRGVVGVYQRFDYFPQMEEAVQKWEAHVTSIGCVTA